MPTSKSSSGPPSPGGPHTFSFELTKEEAVRGRASTIPIEFELATRLDRPFWYLLAAFVGGEIVDALSGRQISGLPGDVPLVGTIGAGLVALIVGAVFVRDKITGRGCYAVGTRTTAQLTDSGFTVDAPGLAARGMWASLRAVKETPEFFLLYVSNFRAVVLPKRAMPQAAVEQVRAIGLRKTAEISRKFALWGRRIG